MTPSPVHRAVERTEKKTDGPASLQEPNTTVFAAALPTPIPIPDEPERMPVIPAPDVAPSDVPPQPPPERPRPNVSRYEGVVLNGESLDDFVAFNEALEDHYMPYNFEERVFVGKLAEARWFLRRRKRVFESVEAGLYKAQPDTSKWGEAEFRRLAVADNYRNEGELAVHHALKKVEEFMMQRTKDYRYEINRDLAQRRLEVLKRRCDVAMHSAAVRSRQASMAAAAGDSATH